MKWNAELYDNKHGFVAEYGKELLEYVPNHKEQTILDVGCGTGTLTYELLTKADKVIGIDGSEDMILKARGKYPQIEFEVMDACSLKWANYFDTVFSNAVFHWIPNQTQLLRDIYRSLKNNGLLICEFGANGCISKIQNAFQNVAKNHGYEYSNPFYYPTTDEYRRLLEQEGFKIDLLTDYDRPTILSDNRYGLKNFIKQFFANDLRSFSETVQNQMFTEIEAMLRSELWDGRQWIADYRRIRVIAHK